MAYMLLAADWLKRQRRREQEILAHHESYNLIREVVLVAVLDRKKTASLNG